MDRDPDVQALLDKQAIHALILRYCRAVDRQDRKLLESVYWSDATDDHGVYSGGAAGWIDFAMKALAPLKTQHFIGNVLIEIDSPTRARAESYVTAFHQVKTTFGGEEMIFGGRYIDTLEKRDGEWRFKDRTLASDYTRVTATTETDRYDGIEFKGGKYPNDPVYRLFA
jgi:hypothetical protein